MFIHDDRGRGVDGLDVDETKADTGFGDKRFEPLGEIDELRRSFGCDPDHSVMMGRNAGERLHSKALQMAAASCGRRDT